MRDKGLRQFVYVQGIAFSQWHRLSDCGLKEALRLRIDLMVFRRFEMGDEVPDETTLCHFRNKLVDRGLSQPLLGEMNHQLCRGFFFSLGSECKVFN